MTRIKTTLLHTAFITAVIFGASSCANNEKPADSKEVAEDHNEAKFDNADKEKDAQFLVNAAEINLEEIKLGQLAQEKGSLAEVRDLGKMMVDAHNKAMNDLSALAKTKVVTIPSAPTDKADDAYKKLNEKTGNKFDKEYCDMMVDGHKEAISKFEKAAADAKDPDIKAWASNMLPELRTHLDHAMICQQKCK